jgi:hypothetical protein
MTWPSLRSTQKSVKLVSPLGVFLLKLSTPAGVQLNRRGFYLTRNFISCTHAATVGVIGRSSTSLKPTPRHIVGPV